MPAAALDTNGSAFAFAPGHFSFRMPYYWTALADDQLALYKDSLRKQFPGRGVPNYVLGLQRKSLFTFSLPYALIELDNCGMPNPKQVEAECRAFSLSVARAYLPLHRSGQFGEVKPMEAVYYTNINVIIGYWQMVRARDNQRLACVSAIYPCGYGYARFHFFMDAGDQDTYLPIVERLIGSVSFDSGFAYKSATPADGTASSLRGMRTTIVMVVVTMVIWLVVRILVRTKMGNSARPRPPYVRR